MICIPIQGKTNAAMRDELVRAKTEPADLYELRLDACDEAPDMPGLLGTADKPVIATCRSREQGGFFAGTREERRTLLQQAIDAGAPYVDAEEDVLADLRRRDGVVLIASWHDFSGTPSDLQAVSDRLASLPCDWIKFAVMATRPADNLTVLRAIETAKKPAIGMAMGEMGLVSRVLGPAYGSRVTFGVPASGRSSAPGQPPARELAEIYRVGSLTKKTRVYGLIGDPVSQSVGYLVHNRAFAATGVDAVYLSLLAPDATEFLHLMPEALGMYGMSVTMPHKHAALEWSGTLSEGAKAIGAVNTLVRQGDGWVGDNTDCAGVAASVAVCAREHGIDLKGAPALVLGSGGAAAATAFALRELGCAVSLSGRTPEKAAAVAARMNLATFPWDGREAGDWLVVANGTSVGMNSDETPFPASGWKKGMIAFDVVYHPRETRMLRDALLAGALAVDGFEMWKNQAKEQFRLWTGLELPDACCIL